MNFIQHIRSLFSSKESQMRVALSMQKLGQAVQTPANYASFSNEGYKKNATVYRCISLIAKTCAGISWELYEKKGNKATEIQDHDLITLMNRPNPMMGQSQFFEALISFFCIAGNTYIESVGPSDKAPPLELWPLRPDLMKIVPSRFGYPAKYILKTGDAEKVWDCDFMSGVIPVLHMKTFNPIDIWYGMSPMEAALLNVDQLNQSNRWNLALLQNNASPSGVLKVETSDVNPTGSLDDKQYTRLKEEFDRNYAGSRNAGKPMILEGGLNWQSIALSPKDMEWLAGKETTVKDVCNVFGVPVMMLGYGDTTYSNYEEARLAFYEDTIIPIMKFLQTELNNWLTPKFGTNLELRYDADDIEPLVAKREKKFTSLATANWITQNEKRKACGYEEMKGWDVFNVNNKLLASPDDWTTVDDTQEVENLDGKENDDDGKSKETSSEESGETENSEEVNSEKAYKLFNPVNKSEINTSWRKVTARKKRIEQPFAKMLQEDFKELARDMEKAAKGIKDARLLEFALLKQIEENTPSIQKTIKRYLKYTVEDFGLIVFDKAKSELKILETKKSQRTWEQWAENYVETRTGRAITEIEGTTKKQVRKTVQRLVSEAILSEDTDIDVAKELGEVFENLSEGRARTIARTEINAASNSATTEAVRSLEVPGMVKVWITNEDARVRDGGADGNGPNHAVMNGAEVGLDEKFTVPPDQDMDGPGDPSADPSQICNCRCTLIYKVRNK